MNLRLIRARVQKYRSIKDTGYFDVEKLKTILVGPNESGKTAILQALQQLNPPAGSEPYNVLRDYPRSLYDEDISKEGIDSSKIMYVEGQFVLDEDEKEQFSEDFKNLVYIYKININNQFFHDLANVVERVTFASLDKDFIRISSQIDNNYKIQNPEFDESTLPSKKLWELFGDRKNSNYYIPVDMVKKINEWLDANLVYIDENGEIEKKYDEVKNKLQTVLFYDEGLKECKKLLPKFVLFSNYFRIKPLLHLEKLAERTEGNILDDKQYDYGNNCLLKFLGYTARELSDLGKTQNQNVNTGEGFENYRKNLDERDYRLNASSIRLTKEIIGAWNPNNKDSEANKLRIKADGQYLKVVVEDDLGVEVELDQRSEGFQWLSSFFVVFFSEAEGKHKNAILLLDEPGMSLHALKQFEFRKTLSILSEKNQTIFTTHSPFLIGSEELDLVRVIEMADRNVGTKVHTSLTANDNGAILPLQEALGYDLAQSLFMHKRNLLLEGLTDYWYIEAISGLLKESGENGLTDDISMIPANCATKVVYYATILHANNLRVVALFDSDNEGEKAATQDVLVNALGTKHILRTKDIYIGAVDKSEIEDLFRGTLIKIAKEILNWDVEEFARNHEEKPVVDIFKAEIKKDFSKFQLAKAFLKWARENTFTDLEPIEQEHCKKLIQKINNALK